MSGNPQDGEGFLTRWSRRKRESHHAPEDVEEAVQTPAGAVAEPDGVLPEGQAGPSEDPELAANREAAEAVDLESLTYESDFTVFMKRGVPDALKNAALRKLWRSNPDLAVLDGLNDYDTDFRTAETAMEGFQSAWKVGRGYADKAEEVRAEMEARSAGTEPSEDVGTAEASAIETRPELETGEPDEAAEACETEQPEVGTDAGEKSGNADVRTGDAVKKVSIRRRMSFEDDG